MNPQFIPINIAVLTISDSRTFDNDTSGKVLEDKAIADGHHVVHRQIVADDIYQIRAIVSKWIAAPDVQAVVTTGGTGLTGRDGTPEAVKVLFDKEIEGFGELFRSLSYQVIKTSTVQSRAIAGVANGTFIFCLPGSSGACRTGWDDILHDQLDIRHKPCNFVDLMPRLLEK
ncbi:molybdenum cofactor biosynthesis protein B [Methylophaga sp. OBS4]|uniref:molybdenum cofactor biosynthesis protein B n=1 Tax=Methylophaga sp. OBS4 TaxID=2991935 RepID=UPI0022571856|nr:molybdenum cofactor biosynthesis protein B [Methylophaga sp. OBS4]MCX4187233.1 molybdenum cofactor biosynthesis protein B [Methylophaga sp. OBS4]